MEPSNFRYNPYDDIPTGVEITERHIIPANSPYYIRLNEVPQKNSPSTMAVKEITDIGTTVTYGQIFNEVAANPAAGEFWPDCNTGANGDDNWNTGLIAFNAADAGKIIEVTYTGIGTLAGINSNHWPSWYTDRGDGSDGDFVPTGNTTISGVKNYKSVFIKEGITVTVDRYAFIKSQGIFINEGTINVSNIPNGGAASAYGGYAGGNGNCSTGGAGANSYSNHSNGASGGVSLNKPLESSLFINETTIGSTVYFGSGGGSGGGYTADGVGTYYSGAGGGGGGSIVIVANTVKNNIINANGQNGGSGSTNKYKSGSGGGGGGGVIAIVCNTIIDQGTLSVAGGAGGTGGNGNGAAGSSGFVFTKEFGGML